jgi:uncharacterized protein
MIDWICYALIGSLAGFFAGLLGIGGGSITLPLLFFVLKPLGLPDTDLMHIVLGTTLSSMILNSAAATYFHYKRGFIPWKTVSAMIPSAVLGPIFGSYVATSLSGATLRLSFGTFQVVLALYFFLPRHKPSDIKGKSLTPLLLNVGTLIIGSMGGILGIGGGIIMVPFLEMMGMHLKKAIATSAFTSCIMLTTGAMSFLWLGLTTFPLLPYQIGYIYLPAFMIITLFSVFTSFLGVQLVERLPVVPLKRIFASGLAVMGLLLILK